MQAEGVVAVDCTYSHYVLGGTMTTYYTKDQAEMILREWGIGEKLPRKGMQVGVQWVGGKQPNHCTITVAESKSTYGNTLYQFQFENRS